MPDVATLRIVKIGDIRFYVAALSQPCGYRHNSFINKGLGASSFTNFRPKFDSEAFCEAIQGAEVINKHQYTDTWSDELSKILASAHDAADIARAAILPHFRKSVEVANKSSASNFDPVTIADKNAEIAIRAYIEKAWPAHGFVGEETGTVREDAPVQWIVDPIDGTRSFIIGSPLWGTLIGVVIDGVPRLGILDQAYTGERFYVENGKTFLTHNDTSRPQQLTTRTCRKLEDAVLMTTHPDHFASDQDLKCFFDLKKRVRLSRYGGDCYSYGLLAAGFVDLVVETGLHPYDIVALIPIVEMAGGCVTTWDGEPATCGGQIIAAGDPALHELALDVLQHART